LDQLAKRRRQKSKNDGGRPCQPPEQDAKAAGGFAAADAGQNARLRLRSKAGSLSRQGVQAEDKSGYTSRPCRLTLQVEASRDAVSCAKLARSAMFFDTIGLLRGQKPCPDSKHTIKVLGGASPLDRWA